ncbi:MAG: tRNA adenosine(34) deaminase TadA [Coxiellaceae bacterium]|jgi:tRNA(adenine34) deaminase|nr:tRNA adenosine(34) deaminase TadA [Coxiellaceae bacterium]
MLGVNQDIFFMEQALNLAKKAQLSGEVPVGAVAIYNNKIIGRGYNSSLVLNDPTSHAEIIALREAAQRLNNYRLKGVDLYVTLEPCLMCAGAMIHARIRRLIFGATDPKTGAIVSVFNIFSKYKLNHSIEFTAGVLASKCSNILTIFFKSKRFKVN